MASYRQRVLDYRYDPMMTTADGTPLAAPRWFPRTCVWLAALWHGLFNSRLYR